MILNAVPLDLPLIGAALFDIEITRYAHPANIAIRLFDKTHIPYATISVNVSFDLESVYGEKAVALKGWSENFGLPEALAEAGIVRLTCTVIPCAYAEAVLAYLIPDDWD